MAKKKSHKMSFSERARLAGKKGGLATGHKGFAATDPKKCKEIWDQAAMKRAIIPEAGRPPAPRGVWLRARNAVLASVSTDTGRRAYRNGIDYFVYWLQGRPLTAETLEEHEEHLSNPGQNKKGYSKNSINVRMAAIRGAVSYYTSRGHR